MKQKSIEKFGKIIISMFLCVVLMPICPTLALEDENMLESIPNKEQHYETSEYGAILSKLKSIENQQIAKKRYNSNELLEVLRERQEYHNYIYELKEKRIDELVDMNFDNTQINAIKTFDGSDEKALLSSAYISATLKLTKFNYTSSTNRTNASATFSGKWVGTPLYKMQDTTAIGMIGSLSRFVKQSSSNAITHADGSVVRNTKSEYHSSAGQSYKFGIANVNGKIFKSFTMTYTAAADGKNTLMDYGAVYAHFKTTFTPTGVSVGVSGSGPSIGISFTINYSHDLEWKHIYPQSSYI